MSNIDFPCEQMTGDLAVSSTPKFNYGKCNKQTLGLEALKCKDMGLDAEIDMFKGKRLKSISIHKA